MEELLVCDALDERDFLKKKIHNQINSLSVVEVKRKQDVKINGIVDVAEFENEAKSKYQSLMDMIERYNRLDGAIILSNANTKVEIGDREMTVAEAINLRKSMYGHKGCCGNCGNGSTDFLGKMLETLEDQHESMICKAAELNDKADRQAEKLKESFVGKDGNKKISDEDISGLDKLTDGLKAERIDPIKIAEKIEELREKRNSILKKIDTAIKVSNATTKVRF